MVEEAEKEFLEFVVGFFEKVGRIYILEWNNGYIGERLGGKMGKGRKEKNTLGKVNRRKKGAFFGACEQGIVYTRTGQEKCSYLRLPQVNVPITNKNEDLPTEYWGVCQFRKGPRGKWGLCHGAWPMPKAQDCPYVQVYSIKNCNIPGVYLRKTDNPRKMQAYLPWRRGKPLVASITLNEENVMTGICVKGELEHICVEDRELREKIRLIPKRDHPSVRSFLQGSERYFTSQLLGWAPEESGGAYGRDKRELYKRITVAEK